MIESLIDAFEVSAQVFVYVGLSLFLRSIGRTLTSRQLTFFKVYKSNLTALFWGGTLNFIRVDQSLRLRASYILVLGCYTTAISVLFAATHNQMNNIYVELTFAGFFLLGTLSQLLMRDDEARSLRHFLFAPLAILLHGLILTGSELHIGASRFHQLLEFPYLVFASVPMLIATVCSVGLIFLFLTATHVNRTGWQGLVEDVCGLAFLTPSLIFFLNEGTAISWILVFVWSIKAGLLLMLFEIFRMFIPQFGLKQPEGTLIRIALPACSILFLVMWASRVQL